MQDKYEEIKKMDEDELEDVSGGAGRRLFAHPYCRVCGKRMGHGPSLFVFVCANVSCSRFNVVTSSKYCDWR